MGKRPYAKPLGMNRASLRASFLDHTAIFLVDYLFVARSQVEQAGLYLSTLCASFSVHLHFITPDSFDFLGIKTHARYPSLALKKKSILEDV